MSRIGLALLALATLLVLSLAAPVRRWPTGEAPHPPFALLPKGSLPALPVRLWIDTDAACGQPGRTDPDDCLALLLFAQMREPPVVGVSTVFGNAPLDATDTVTRRFIGDVWARNHDAVPPVHRGSAERVRKGASIPAAPAHAALRAAIQEGPLTILALGPLTNVAAALEGFAGPERRALHLVAVMGRRPGHLFHPAEGAGGGILFGHGPVFRDFNFDMDPEAAAHVLQSRYGLTLIPYEVGRRFQVTGADLDSMTERGGAPAWVAERSRTWLRLWRDDSGTDGFYPFDLLAAAYITHPEAFGCARVGAWVGRGLALRPPWVEPALLVGQPRPAGADTQVDRTAVYCTEIDPQLGSRLRAELIR